MKLFSLIMALIIQLFLITSGYSRVYDAYFKKATLKENGEYKYEERIKKKDTKNIPYYVIGYEKRRRVYEKHYSSANRLTFYAKYIYESKKKYTKMEFLIYQRLLKIKIKDPQLMDTDKGVYNKIKYLRLQGKEQKLYKVEEYHSNGMLHVVSHFDLYKGNLQWTETFDREGKKTLAQYYRYVNDKRYLWKEERLDKDKDKKEGYWYTYYDADGKETDKRFYPIPEKTDSSS